MSSRSKRILWVLVASAFALGAISCGPSDPADPAYWEAKLKTPERKKLIRKLAGMGDKAEPAIPALVKMYDRGREKGEIVTTLAQLKPNKPEVVELLSKAIADPTEQSAAAAAADALGDMGAKSKIKDLLAVLDMDMEDEVKAAALRSLIKFKDPSTVDDLIRIVDGDPDKQWIHLNALACRALGEIGPPEANKAIPALVRGLFLRDRYQRLAFKDCAIGLLKFGEEAGKAVVTAMDGKDEVLNEMAKKRGFVDGLIPEEGVKMLRLLHYKPAAKRVAQELTIKINPPAEYDAKKREIWAAIEAQRFQNALEALGHIGDESVIPDLAAWLYKDEYLRRVRVPLAIATIGGEAAYKELHKCAKTALLDELTWFRVDCAQYMSYLAKPEQVKDLQGVLEGLEKTEKELKETEAQAPGSAKPFIDRLEGVKAVSAAIEECGTKSGCWIKKMDDKNFFVKEKAVWELAQMEGDPKAMDALLAQVGTESFELRNAILQKLPLVCDERCAPPIEKVMDEEEGKTAFKGFRDVMEFVLVQVKMKKA